MGPVACLSDTVQQLCLHYTGSTWASPFHTATCKLKDVQPFHWCARYMEYDSIQPELTAA